jgi:hypothetical protein
MNPFDKLAALYSFSDRHTAAIRESLVLLLPRLGELVAEFDFALKRVAAQEAFAGLEGERRERLQSLMASFILRTANCNFDQAYCEYVAEISQGKEVPAGFFSFGLGCAQDFVCRVLPQAERDAGKLAEKLSAWNRLCAVLRELTR